MNSLDKRKIIAKIAGIASLMFITGIYSVPDDNCKTNFPWFINILGIVSTAGMVALTFVTIFDDEK
jgi:hypothetical protein